MIVKIMVDTNTIHVLVLDSVLDTVHIYSHLTLTYIAKCLPERSYQVTLHVQCLRTKLTADVYLPAPKVFKKNLIGEK